MFEKLSLPVIVAPMFLVSSVELVIASCKNGLVGSIPMLNARTAEDAENMLKQLKEALPTEPWAVNFIAHKTNKRHDSDLELIRTISTTNCNCISWSSWGSDRSSA